MTGIPNDTTRTAAAESGEIPNKTAFSDTTARPRLADKIANAGRSADDEYNIGWVSKSERDLIVEALRAVPVRAATAAPELPPFEHPKTSPSWGRSLDHLLHGCEFMAKGKDWQTTEIIRRKLQAHDNAMPTEEELACAIYEADEVFMHEDSGEYIDGFQVSPGGHISWAQLREMTVAGCIPYLKAARAVLALLPVPKSPVNRPVWQPIATAPKDGTEIILGVFNPAFVDPLIMNSCWVDGEERGCYWHDWHGNPAPTHWMPVNAPVQLDT